MSHRIQAKSLAHALLAVAAIGGITLVALMAPNALQMLGRRNRREEWWAKREAERRRIRAALERLRRRRLVAYEERRKETYITVTAEGRRYLRKFEFNDLALTPPGRWDGQWRMVVFDIPEARARERKALRDKLRDLGFFQLQKSVWVYPHDCHDEIDFLTRFLDIDRYILYLETPSLDEREGPMRKRFGLLLSNP